LFDGSEATCKLSKQRKNENLKLALRERGGKKTYSNGDYDQVGLLYSPPQVQQWVPLEKLIEKGSEDLERS